MVPELIRYENSADTRNRILGAAAKLFSARGFRGTTTRAISQIVGILSGSLFHYFQSKHEMLVEVMQEAAQSVCEQAEAIAASAASPRERLRGLIWLQLQCIAGERTREFYAVLISEWRELDAAAKPRLTALRKRHFAAWHQVLSDCEQRGLLRADPHGTQLALHGAINWANTWYKPTGRMRLEDYAAVLENFVLERDTARTNQPATRRSARAGR